MNETQTKPRAPYRPSWDALERVAASAREHRDALRAILKDFDGLMVAWQYRWGGGF